MPSSNTALMDQAAAIARPQGPADASGWTLAAPRPNTKKESYPSYPRGAWLCAEGSPATGVYIVRSGRVKETLSSSDGKKLIVRVLGPGQIVGLTAVLSGHLYDVTAEALELTQAEFISAKDFLHNMESSPQMGLSVVSQLSQNCKDVYDNLRRLTFPANVTQRLARLVQEWYQRALPGKEGQECRFQVTLTQEEIAQMVGSTRETVSRILMDFRRKGWLRAKGVTWVVTNPGALLRLAEAGERRR